jgi:branched-chain amino acid transport system permease protein
LTAIHPDVGPSPAARTAGRLQSDRWRPIEIVFWLVPVLSYFVFARHLVLGTQILIVGLSAISVDLLLGFAGIITIGQAAFFGLGGYSAALLCRAGWGEPVTGLLVGGAVAAIGAYFASFLIVRGNDLTRILVTLGMCLMLYEAANKAAFITGGADGLAGVATWKLFGLFDFDLAGKTAYVYSLAVLFLIFVFLRRLVNSPLGLSLRGLREGASRMPAIGAPVRHRQAVIYVISAAIAGVAGALLAQTTQFVGLDTLSFSRSADLLIMLALGGTGYLYGGIVGAAMFLLIQDYVSDISPVYWQFWIGFLLVVFVLCARGGVLGALQKLQPWLRGSRR